MFTPLVVLLLLDLRRLLDGSKRLAEGNLDHSVATDHMFSPLRRQANYLNGIRDGMRNAVEERMQSERMKTELITNVSHDIKTPLTSIVNYSQACCSAMAFPRRTRRSTSRCSCVRARG